MSDDQKLKCKGLCKNFGGVKALDDVSLSFPPSGIVALIGPNGAGKTTLLNAFTGVIKLDAGKCHLGNEDITGAPIHYIASLGIARTFQNLRLVGRISVIENVILALKSRSRETVIGALFRHGAIFDKRSCERAAEILEYVGLSVKADVLANNLSYGQQKLLCIACGLASTSSILLLDEPVSGIHPEMISKTINLLKKIARSNKLILFTEHNIDMVRATAERVIVISNGRVFDDGPLERVLNRSDILEAYFG